MCPSRRMQRSTKEPLDLTIQRSMVGKASTYIIARPTIIDLFADNDIVFSSRDVWALGNKLAMMPEEK